MKVIVGVADMKISNNKDDVLITYALGSCLGITIFDPVAHVGGLLHVMLPVASVDPIKAKSNPYMFVDTGVPRLFTESYKLGAKKERLVVKVAGGASTNSEIDEDFFKIGKRNFVLLRKVLWKNGVLLKAYDVGQNHSRTMSLDIGTGQVIIKISGKSENEL
ncbi:chemotaxis protein CheD [candidate division KSB1 bacterium]|nr:chemotaxis protein CheD [candidate division KSB1 bacterium]